MSNMLIYVYQICPHTLWWSGPGKLSSVGGESGRGSQRRKEIPSFSEASGWVAEACSRCYFLKSFGEKLPGGHLFPFYGKGKKPSGVKSESPEAMWATVVACAFLGLWTGLRSHMGKPSALLYMGFGIEVFS